MNTKYFGKIILTNSLKRSSNMIKYYSFDIFDTCLTRACGSANVVFDILANRILGTDSSSSQRMDFAKERIDGEKRARLLYCDTDHEDVTLDQIYRCCDFSRFSSLPSHEISEVEMAIESSLLLSVKKIKDIIDKLHRENKKVLFVSDMYLPYDFIKQILSREGLFRNDDELYVSGHVGKTKHSGNLFRYVLSQLNVNPDELLHYGDNHHSDVNVPRSLGIRVEHVNHELSEYERVLWEKDFSCDYGHERILASIAKSIRLYFGQESEILMASDIIAPMWLPFVHQVLEVAKQKGIKKLFFCARDANIFYKISLILSKRYPDIDLKYLYVSRSSLYLPGLKDVTYESISGMFWNFPNITLNDLLERLHLEDLDVSKYQLSTHEITDQLKELLSHSDFVAAIEEQIRVQKELLLQYFDQIGLKGSECAIVDLVGTRKCQKSINQILSSANKGDIFAFYYYVLSNRINDTGNYYSQYYEDRFSCNVKNYSLTPQDIFEQYFCITDQQRTYSYGYENDRVRPVFEDDIADEIYKKKVYESNVLVCEKFALLYMGLLMDQDPIRCSNSMASVYSYFYYVPQIEYLESLRNIVLCDSKMSAKRLFDNQGIVVALGNHNHPWRNANIVLSSRCPKLIYRLLRVEYYHHFDGSTCYLTYDRMIQKKNRCVHKMAGFFRKITS